MPVRLETTQLISDTGQVIDEAFLTLLREVRRAVADRYTVLGWLERRPDGSMLYLARENETDDLIGVRALPDGRSDKGTAHFQLRVVRAFEPSNFEPGGRCDNCEAQLTGWERDCKECGFSTSSGVERELVESLAPSELLGLVRSRSAPRFEVFGAVDQTTVKRRFFFAREVETAQLAILTPRSTTSSSTAATERVVITCVKVCDPGLRPQTSPHSGPLGSLGDQAPQPTPRPQEQAAAEPARNADLRRRICPTCQRTYSPESRFCTWDRTELVFEGEADPLVGDVFANRYRIVRKLGAGGMGRVYLAEHLTMGRLDAIKVMLPGTENDPDAAKRFAREARNAGQIRHRNVAIVYDHGEYASGAFFIAMEYVEGETLKQYLASRTTLPIDEALDIAGQIADGLQAAHRLKEPVIHRDLKPDNVLIGTDDDRKRVVKVVDFGIAKAAEGTGQLVSRTGVVIGTPPYMSLEQLKSEPLDPRSDVFALGCLLFEMVTGRRAFNAVPMIAALHERMSERIPHPRDVKPDIPEALDALIHRAIARRKEERFASVEEMRAAMRALATKAARPTPRSDEKPRKDESAQSAQKQDAPRADAKRSIREDRIAAQDQIAALGQDGQPKTIMIGVIALAAPFVSAVILGFLLGVVPVTPGSHVLGIDLSSSLQWWLVHFTWIASTIGVCTLVFRDSWSAGAWKNISIICVVAMGLGTASVLVPFSQVFVALEDSYFSFWLRQQIGDAFVPMIFGSSAALVFYTARRAMRRLNISNAPILALVAFQVAALILVRAAAP